MEVTPFPPKMGKCFDSASVRDGNGITLAVLAPRHPTCSITVSITLSSRRDALSPRLAASTRMMMPLEMGPHCTHASVITLPLATR